MKPVNRSSVVCFFMFFGDEETAASLVSGGSSFRGRVAVCDDGRLTFNWVSLDWFTG